MILLSSSTVSLSIHWKLIIPFPRMKPDLVAIDNPYIKILCFSHLVTISPVYFLVPAAACNYQSD
jgi:hypothetical protein